MRRTWHGPLLAVCLAAAWAVSAGVAAAEQRPIVAIEFEGLRALPPETLKYYLGLTEGRPFDEEALDRSIKLLWERRLIDDISVRAEEEAAGVRLVIRVVERPTLRSLDFEGLKKVSRSDITERIAKDQIDVREGSGVSLGEIARLEAAIEEMYREKGYRFAEARHRLEELGPNERRLVFSVDEGDQVRIRDISFPGAEVFGEWRLRWAMKKTKETGPIIRLLKRDIYNPATFQEDLENLRKVYRAAGYKNVAIGEPKIEVRAKNPGARTAKEQKRRLFLEIPIEEGERWRLGEISIEGNKVFSDEMILRRFRRRPGGWLSAKGVDETVTGIRELYNNFGHIYAQVEPELVEREGNVADLVVRIQEGDQYKVGRLEFEGNTTTRDKVLRREFRVHEGTVLNMGAVKNSLFKINQLGYFKLNEDEPVSFANFDTENKTVDLLIKGEEADRTELQIGGGWSEVDGFFGQLSVRTQNFLGRGETLGAAFQSGRYRDEFNVSYGVPWFLDKPQSIGIQLFKSDLDYEPLLGYSYARQSDGGIISYGRSLGLFSQLSLSYNRSRLDDRRSAYNFEGELIEQRFQLDNSSLRPVYLYESRDSRTEPTRGMRFSASFEYAGGFLGGDSYFYRPEVGFSWFKPVNAQQMRMVLATNVEAGWVEPFDGRELSFLESYYLGGETSVRGFRFRSIWARDKDGKTRYDELGFPLGGNKFLQLNLEYHFLLSGPFRVLLFADGGAVYAEDQSVDLGGLRMSAGAELRIFVPVFGAPLRFIYASNLDELEDDSFESFQFSIGATF
ncbi:MAG: outer membrane protein assembly factor BamA [Thermoanaerobaculia bacterium]|nr:outer membrane protein assembly factor BamA [Thermoanaerobaculia bacterium]